MDNALINNFITIIPYEKITVNLLIIIKKFGFNILKISLEILLIRKDMFYLIDIWNLKIGKII